MVKTGTKWIGMAAIGLGLIASTASYAQKAHWHLGAETEVVHYNSDQKDKSGATATKTAFNNIFVKKAEVKLTGHLGDGFVVNIANDFMFNRAFSADPAISAANSVTAANVTYSGLADGLTLKLGKYLTVPTAQFNSPVAYSWNDVGPEFGSVYSLLWREAVGLSYVNDGFSLHFDGGNRDVVDPNSYAETKEGASKFSHVTRLGYMSDVMDDMAFAVAVNNMRENHNLSQAANGGSLNRMGVELSMVNGPMWLATEYFRQGSDKAWEAYVKANNATARKYVDNLSVYMSYLLTGEQRVASKAHAAFLANEKAGALELGLLYNFYKGFNKDKHNTYGVGVNYAVTDNVAYKLSFNVKEVTHADTAAVGKSRNNNLRWTLAAKF